MRSRLARLPRRLVAQHVLSLHRDDSLHVPRSRTHNTYVAGQRHELRSCLCQQLLWQQIGLDGTADSTPAISCKPDEFDYWWAIWFSAVLRRYTTAVWLCCYVSCVIPTLKPAPDPKCLRKCMYSSCRRNFRRPVTPSVWTRCRESLPLCAVKEWMPEARRLPTMTAMELFSETQLSEPPFSQARGVSEGFLRCCEGIYAGYATVKCWKKCRA